MADDEKVIETVEPKEEVVALDVTEAELEASAAAMQQMTAQMYQAQEAALTAAWQSSQSEEAKAELATRISAVQKERDSVLGALPKAITTYQQFLVEKSKETGVPVRELAKANNPQELELKVISWKMSHPDRPKEAPKEAPKVEEKNTEEVPVTPRGTTIDSGITTTKGGDDWRKLPPHQRMLHGLV